MLLGIFMFGGIGLSLLGPQVLRYFIDTAKSGGALGSLIRAGVLFLLISLVRQLVQLVSAYLGQEVGWRATNHMRENLARHCLSLDMSFHHTHTPGDMVERVDGDTTTLSNFFSQFVLEVIGNTLLVVGILIVVSREDWRIGIALTAFAAVAFTVYNLTRSIGVPIYTAERETYSRLYGFIEERLIGIEDMRTNGGNPYTMGRFYDFNRHAFQRVLKSEFMGEVLISISRVMFALGYALAMGMSIYLYRDGTFTLGTVFMVFQYTAMIRAPLDQISRQINDLQKATAGLKRIEQFHHMTPQIQDGTESLAGSGALSVNFNDVTFSYVEDEVVLKDVSFKLKAGKVLGLLGRTGSGKTTITRLLFRLYDPDAGQIRLGDAPITDVRLDSLREHAGLVTQDVQIFHATVRENLSLFDPTVPDSRMLEVIKEFRLSTWYESLPDGLDTVVTSGGLSAGEAQLLAFARVFLKDPGVVILDEPSSRLDPVTEAQIDKAVERLLRDRTAIIIAHRLRTVQKVDEIMILEDGQVGEYGEREKLIENPNSRFSHLLRTGLEEVIAA